MALQLKNLECKTQDSWDCPKLFLTLQNDLIALFPLVYNASNLLNTDEVLCVLYVFIHIELGFTSKTYEVDRGQDLLLSEERNSL